MNQTFYKITASSDIAEYLRLGAGLEAIQPACAGSELQFLDHKPIHLEIDGSSGPVCQDFIYERGVPLVSERMKEFFDNWGIDYLFYKRVLLERPDTGIAEPYWLALPPRINCLDLESMEVDDLLGTADHLVICARQIGRYDIFKLARVTNLDIIVTEKLAAALREEDFVGLYIFQINI